MAARAINNEQFYELLKGSKPLLVDYSAPWCGYCRRIAPAYDRVAKHYEDRIEVVAVNIDEEEKLADAEQIEVIPTLVLYKNGKAVDSIVTPESKAMIDAFIERNNL